MSAAAAARSAEGSVESAGPRRAWRRPGPAWGLCLGLALASAAAQAGTVQLAVLDKDGKPAADVVVLIALPYQPTPPAKPSVPVTIAQEGLRFQPFLSVVAAGTTLRFVNRDEYDHHVRSVPSGPLSAVPPASRFELRLAAGAAGSEPRGSTAEVTVAVPGAIGLGCHLHASMRGQVYVSATPWFAKTDAQGLARVEGVPEGAVEIRLWHSDQLQDQAPLRLSVGADTLKAEATLNFTPRRRRP